MRVTEIYDNVEKTEEMVENIMNEKESTEDILEKFDINGESTKSDFKKDTIYEKEQGNSILIEQKEKVIQKNDFVKEQERKRSVPDMTQESSTNSKRKKSEKSNPPDELVLFGFSL